MYEIDKQQFGTFVARLRKEQGWTQKDMAARLFISDKAISKWETGASLPDTAMLIPLSELLEISVTELLMCRRMQLDDQLASHEVERIVQTAISYSEETPARAYQSAGKWPLVYLLSLFAGLLGLYLCHMQGQISEPTLTAAVLGAVFGAYFCFFVVTRLPGYYDENRIGGVMDVPFRMNVPGMVFNNRNWPHMVTTGKIWACATAGLYPLLSAAMRCIMPNLWLRYELYTLLALLLGGLFIPMYIIGKKYE